MKLLAGALLLLACNTVQAEEVVSAGYGKTVEQAMQNAKTTAVEQAASTFIVGHAALNGEAYEARIEQYNGGLIRRYTLESTEDGGGLIKVVIRADVDTDKINSVIQSASTEAPMTLAAQLEKSRDDFEKTQAIITALDDPTKAFGVEIGKIVYSNRGALTDVEVNLKLVYSPKWYDDVRVMAKTIGRKVDTGSWFAEALWGLASLAAVVNPMLPGTLSNIARMTNKTPEASNEYMACFGRDTATDIDACYEIRHPFPRTTATSAIRVAGRLVLPDREIALKPGQIRVGNALYMDVRTGQRVYFTGSAKERTFYNPGVLLFERGTVPFRYTFTVSTDTLKLVDRLEFQVI